MRLLLDTHAILWWTEGNDLLSAQAHNAIAEPENEIHVSAVSAYEIAYKHQSGKLPLAERLAQAFEVEMAAERFELLAVNAAHARVAALLAIPHRDPFDRLLIAQSQVEGLVLVSNERLFDKFSVNRLW